tara:strand:+ start:67 stop:303 length:237 start_codon:yes stop_codon:yes gene_type:complete
MSDFEIGDLVEVKKDNDLSPTLRFYYNKKGMIVKLTSESHKSNSILLQEWEILFADGKRTIFKNYELALVARANEKKS